MLPQSAALPLVVKSSFGEWNGATSTTSASNSARGAAWTRSTRRVTRAVRPSHMGLKGWFCMAVFVLDRHHRPLMPCSEKRARLLLARQRAVVHRLAPFTIRLKDRLAEASAIQPVVLKVDPGSR